MSNNKTESGAVIWSIYQFMERFPTELAARQHIE